MEEVRVIKPIKKVGGTVSLPGSKSISNRALLLAALSRGTTHLKNLLVAEDTDMMIGALKELGVKLEQHGDEVIVQGCLIGNVPADQSLFIKSIVPSKALSQFIL